MHSDQQRLEAAMVTSARMKRHARRSSRSSDGRRRPGGRSSDAEAVSLVCPPEDVDSMPSQPMSARDTWQPQMPRPPAGRAATSSTANPWLVCPPDDEDDEYAPSRPMSARDIWQPSSRPPASQAVDRGSSGSGGPKSKWDAMEDDLCRCLEEDEDAGIPS
eukprot:CAMPEP_0115318544 /NCGR_PEP_ID=MMETSP0270-20121206/79264_1 /TAXON_ID=71861 /ORGANISM="Scrippsiella trochoidea, Strain CCMP3099" /LENGTH=160 /DNA_ID=CAMNT_0002738127 /DNA_START=143 /DNA_END=621 /DNA_ORIENTATION=-